MATEAQKKLFYKIGEVCSLTDTQPYVLRFWESEFPQLAPRKNRTGQRLYRHRDVEMVLEIKKLLYDEGYTIAGARKKLGMEIAVPADAIALVPGADSGADAAILMETQEELRSSLQEILDIMESTDRRLKRR